MTPEEIIEQLVDIKFALIHSIPNSPDDEIIEYVNKSINALEYAIKSVKEKNNDI